MNTYTLAATIAGLKNERRLLDEQIKSLTDLAQIPSALMVSKPDLSRIGELLRRGKTVPGARLNPKLSLRVYPTRLEAAPEADLHALAHSEQA
jgi:hypothetical protein